MYLEIIAPDKVFFKGETDKVSVPGTAGRFTILKGHAAIISLLNEGDVIYSDNGSDKHFNIISGMVEAKDDKIVVCVDKRTENKEEPTK